jgi:PDDEXK-like domain of unknown function (DUF3799)
MNDKIVRSILANLNVHPPGVYLGMPAEEYHADPSLGSTDIRAIRKGPRRYWLSSKFNPHHEKYRDEDTKATVVGTAIHVYLLDGLEMFLGKYVRRPEDPSGLSSGQKATATKEYKKSLVPGQILLSAKEYELVESSGAVIAAHPDLRNLFKDSFREVSVFWVNEHGIPCKVRWDILKPRGIGDIKSIANEKGRRFDLACKLAIKQFSYHIQAAHYLEGRRQLARLVGDDKVYVWVSPYETVQLSKNSVGIGAISLDNLRKCAKETEFAFQFIFVSKSLPEAWACTLSPKPPGEEKGGNDLLTTADDQIYEAFGIYLFQLRRFGTQPWADDWALHELAMEDMPGGHFGWD